MIRTAAFRIVAIVMAVITLAAVIAIPVVLRLQAWYGAPEALPLLDFIIGLTVYILTLLILLAFTWGFSGLQITKEKVNGNIECLMATPMGPKALWAGKCLATLIPGFAISFVAAALVLLAVNLFLALPGWDSLLVSGPSLVVSLAVNPALFAGVLAFIVLLSLAGNPDVAITPAFLVGFGLMVGIPAGIATGFIDMTSWNFTLWYTAGAALMWLINLCLLRLLTRQNMVLSSKGS